MITKNPEGGTPSYKKTKGNRKELKALSGKYSLG